MSILNASPLDPLCRLSCDLWIADKTALNPTSPVVAEAGKVHRKLLRRQGNVRRLTNKEPESGYVQYIVPVAVALLMHIRLFSAF